MRLLVLGSALLLACSSPLESNDDAAVDQSVVEDMSCPNHNISSGVTEPATCADPPTKVCRYFESYCICLAGEWSCCENGGAPPGCLTGQRPKTGDPCCQNAPLYPAGGPICQYGCAGGMTTTCICGDDLRWQCSLGPLPDGGIDGCVPDAGI